MPHIFASFHANTARFGRFFVIFLGFSCGVAFSAFAQETVQAMASPGSQGIAAAAAVAPPADAVVMFRQPAFPGGSADLAKFLSRNLQYPSEAADAHVSGRVVVSFWVDEVGHAYGFGAVQSPHPALEAEALRVARKIDRWEPGLQEGRPATMQMYLPVVFKLMAQ